MKEIINTKNTDKEITALRDEMYELKKKPDYKEYSSKYTQNIGKLGYKIPLTHQYEERKALRKFYSIGGWCLILHFLLSNAIGCFIILTIEVITKMYNIVIDNHYSLLIGMNAIIYMFCNTLVGEIGIRWMGIKNKSLIQTKDFSFGKVFQYCMIGLFIWIFSIHVSNVLVYILNKYNIDILCSSSMFDIIGKTFIERIMIIIYVCIIAPITEEILYRGMFMKTLAKADQMVAITASALFFGIAHGNVIQFIFGFFTGIFLAHITIKHVSIIPSIIVHMFINTVYIIFSYLYKKLENNVYLNCILFAMAIFGIVMLLIFISNEDLPIPTPYHRKRGWAVALSSIPLISAFMIMFFYMLYQTVCFT